MNPQLFMLLMFKIIAQLPPLVIIKCKCVNKEWRDFISSNDFLLAHAKYSRDSIDQRLITTGRPARCVSHLLNHQSPNYLIGDDVRLPPNVHPKNMLFLASLDGMLCVSLKNTWDLLVWNPVTGACRILSNSVKQGFFKAYFDAIGFYVDATYDYNILHIKRRRCTLSVYVFSLRLGRWEHVPFLKKSPYHGGLYNWSLGTFCKDALYFMVSEVWIDGNNAVIRFDVNTHQFSEIEYPNIGFPGPDGALFSRRSELHAYVSSGYNDRPLELLKLENSTWIKQEVYQYRVALPFPALTVLTQYNLNDSVIVITGWGQILEIDLILKEVRGFLPAHFYDINHGAVYTETLISPWD